MSHVLKKVQTALGALAGRGAGDTAKLKTSEVSAKDSGQSSLRFNSNSSSTLYVSQELPVEQPGFQPSGFISLSFPQSTFGDLL